MTEKSKTFLFYHKGYDIYRINDFQYLLVYRTTKKQKFICSWKEAIKAIDAGTVD